jgi:hypothetical protein
MQHRHASVPLREILGGETDSVLRQPLSLRMKLALLHLIERDRGADAAQRGLADRVKLLNASTSFRRRPE